MSLFVRARPRAARHANLTATTAADIIPRRTGGRVGSYDVNSDSALRHSAVWACIKIRAELISTFPCDCYRKVLGLQVEVNKPPVLVTPGGEAWDYVDWMHASQVDLDRVGNTVGLITERNAMGLPARIDLQPAAACSVIQRKNDPTVRWRINGILYEEDQVWHERAFPVPGMVLGLSPIAYAAYSIGEYMSLQDFAISWFNGGAMPRAHLRNNARTLKDGQADQIKERYKSTMSAGDIFVTGNDWEYKIIQAEQAGMEWLEGRKYGLADISRFFGVPADLIEAAMSASGSVRYANITQRNLQFLIMQLGPAVIRREKNLSKLLPQPRYVKINTDAMLRMDPEAREKVIRSKLETMQMTITEARELENRPPYTPSQWEEAETHFGKTTTPAQPGDNESQPDEEAEENDDE